MAGRSRCQPRRGFTGDQPGFPRRASSGNGYRLTELGPANNPSGWAGVIKLKTPAGTILGYILLYSNP